MRLLGYALLVAAFMVGTVWLGWWSVPVIAAAWAWIAAGTRRPVLAAALAAGSSWVALLGWGWTASRGGASALTGMLAGVMRVPAGALIVVTILYPVLLAASAAQLALAARRQFT